MSSSPGASLLVISRYSPETIAVDESGVPKLEDPVEIRKDSYDDYNHPRIRRAAILTTLSQRSKSANIVFKTPSEPSQDLLAYDCIHSRRLIDFLSTAWDRWEAMGGRRDPLNSMNVASDDGRPPPLVPGNFALTRNKRPSENVMGQIGFFCTDSLTPVFHGLKEELQWDLAVLQEAVAASITYKVVYALATHPGHHAAHDYYGGYCYFNIAAFAAKTLQLKYGYSKVAIVDVDYHCGDGSASIFDSDRNIMVVSLHCHPDYEYPYHSGFEDEVGTGEGEGTTMHVPLPPGTNWKDYMEALERVLDSVFQKFGAQALVVSMGLDTHDKDPVASRGCAFQLKGDDYSNMGKTIAKYCQSQTSHVPTIVVQEGGYKMDNVPDVATRVLMGFLD